MGREHFSPIGLHHVPKVAPAAGFQVRREQGEEPQLGEHLGFRLQAGMDEQAVLMRIGDNLLGDPVTPTGIDISDSETQRVGEQALMGVHHTAFIAEEGFPVGDEVLQIADLWPIDGRIVDLVQDALGDGEPDPAQSRVSGAHPVFVTACPAGFDPRIPGSRICL